MTDSLALERLLARLERERQRQFARLAGDDGEGLPDLRQTAILADLELALVSVRRQLQEVA